MNYQIESPVPLPEVAFKAGLAWQDASGVPVCQFVTIRPSPPCALRRALETLREQEYTLQFDDGEIHISDFCAKALAAEAGEETALPVWLTRDKFIPDDPHWYYVKNLDGSLSSRYWDDVMKVWYNSNARDGWTPNVSITHWLHIPGVHGKHNQPIPITETLWPPSEPADAEAPEKPHGVIVISNGSLETNMTPEELRAIAEGPLGTIEPEVMEHLQKADEEPAPPQSAEDSDRAFEEAWSALPQTPDIVLQTSPKVWARRMWHAALAWKGSQQPK